MTAKLTITYTWTSTVPTDLDIFAISPGGADHGPGSPDDTSTGSGIEVLTVTDPVDGVWHVRSVAALAPLPASAHAVATLTTAARPTTAPPPPPAPGAPTFVNYPAPDDCTAPNTPPGCIQPALGSTTASTHSAGEPSIGVNWSTGKAFVQAGNHTLRVTFNDTVKPVTATWEDQRSPFARLSLDPILYTDDNHFGGANRTFSSQLNGVTSELSYTDDDGNTWIPTQGSGQPAGVDHQTVGGGPYALSAPLIRTSYPHAIYYCSQDIVTAFCSRSDDGGLTFGPGVPIYFFASVNGVDRPVAPGTCGGLHGHVRVSPDGTAYVPNESCFDANNVSRPFPPTTALAGSCELYPTPRASTRAVTRRSRRAITTPSISATSMLMGTQKSPCPMTAASTGRSPKTRARHSGFRIQSSPKSSREMTTARLMRSWELQHLATPSRPISEASGICMSLSRTTAVALGPPRTRHPPTPFSAVAFGTRAAATRAAICSTSTTSRWTSLDAY